MKIRLLSTCSGINQNTSTHINYMETEHVTWRINTTGQNQIDNVEGCMLDRMSAAAPPPAAAAAPEPEPSAPKAPCLPSPWGFMGGGGDMDWRTDGRRHLTTSRPWFYPVVEQHDVTYHRVKPLTWHRRQRHNAKTKQKKWEHTANRKITTDTERRTWRTAGWWVEGGVEDRDVATGDEWTQHFPTHQRTNDWFTENGQSERNPVTPRASLWSFSFNPAWKCG